MLYIVKTPKMHYIFEIYKNNLVIKMNRKLEIIAENVSKFCTALDSKNNIHIVFLTKNGKLKHTVYGNNLEIDNIANFKPYYNINYIKAIVIKSGIHLFYVMSNSENKSNYICHCYCINGKWTVYKISKIDRDKNILDYSLQYLNCEIYLLFCKRKNIGEYKLMKYKVDTNNWIQLDSLILKEVDKIKFFINSSNEGIIYYNRVTDKGDVIYISLKDLNNFDFSWFIKMLPETKIFYVKGSKYILSENSMKTIYESKNDIQLYKNNVRLSMQKAVIISNRDCDIKLYNSCCAILITLINLYLKKYFKTKEFLNNELINIQSDELKTVLGEIENKDNYIKTLLVKIEDKDKVINNQYSKNEHLSEQMDLQNTKIKEIQDKLNEIEEINKLKSQENSKLIYKYENQISIIENEKDKLIDKLNSKLYSMFKIMEEKDAIIEKLH